VPYIVSAVPRYACVSKPEILSDGMASEHVNAVPRSEQCFVDAIERPVQNHWNVTSVLRQT